MISPGEEIIPILTNRFIVFSFPGLEITIIDYNFIIYNCTLSPLGLDYTRLFISLTAGAGTRSMSLLSTTSKPVSCLPSIAYTFCGFLDRMLKVNRKWLWISNLFFFKGILTARARNRGFGFYLWNSYLLFLYQSYFLKIKNHHLVIL